MRIAVIGTGSVGSTLGRRLAEHHDVVFGVRDPAEDKVQRVVAKSGARARAARVGDMLWIHLALFQGLGPQFAFALLRR